MRENQTNRSFLFWLLIGLGALANSVLGQALSTTDYVNTWYPLGTINNNWAPLGTSFYGGSDFQDGVSRTDRSAPANDYVRIGQSRFGMAFGAIETTYNLGQALPAPLNADIGKQPIIRSTDTNRVTWIDYDHNLYAIDQGAVTVSWLMKDGSTNPITYTVSDIPVGRPVRLYWTESPYLAPSVNLPVAPILPKIWYNNQIADTNMVWLDTGNNLFARKGVRGKFLLTYSSRDVKGATNLLGAEIVEVLEPSVIVQPAVLGERLLPATMAQYGTEDLTAEVSRGLKNSAGQNNEEFLYRHTQGRQKDWIFAVRKTEAPWQIEVYWMAKSKLDVKWPFEVDHYSAGWPANTQLYVRGDPNSGNRGPSVQFPDSLIVQLMDFQEPKGHAILSGKSLSTTQPGLCLLRYQDGDEVFFESVQSVYNTDADRFDLQDWSWDIGRELQPEPPKTHGAIDFKGGFVSVTNFPGGVKSALTIEAWVSLRSLAPGKILPIVQKGALGYNLMVTNGALACGDGGTHWAISTGHLPANRWAHAAVVAQSDGSVQFYIDGYPAGHAVFDDSHLPFGEDGENSLFIGRSGDGANSENLVFDGSLDEVRIWSSALSRSNLAQWMNRPLASDHPSYQHLAGEFRFEEQSGISTMGRGANGTFYSGVLSGNVGWQASGAHLESEPAFTGLYTQWPGYVQFSTGDRFNLDLYHYPTNTSATPPVSQVFAVNTGRLEVWWANQTHCGTNLAIFWPSLVNFYTNRWPAEPSQIVIASGLGTASATLDRGAAACLSFDGIDDCLEAGDIPNLRFTDNFTLECWVKLPAGAAGALPLLSKGMDEYTLAINAGTLRFLNKISSGTLDYSSANKVPAGKWSHVAVTYASGLNGLRFYIDGQPSGQSDLPLGGLEQGFGALWIGAGQAQIGKFIGQMDEVRFWNRVLTPAEIAHSMYAKASRDDRGLVASYSFDPEDITDGTLIDSSGNANPAIVSTPAKAPLENLDGIPWAHPGQSFAQQQPKIYYQNNPALPGYNPNEEHALVVGDMVYALRDDFNTASDPAHVLVQYSPAEISPRQAMAVFKVVQTNDIYSFRRDIVAGNMIQAPLPLSLLSPANCSESYYTPDDKTNAVAWRDRNNAIWAQNAADDGINTASLTMRYYYPVQESFSFPGENTPPSVGDHIPWLSGHNVDQLPRDWVYTVSWPESAPVMSVVSTLIEARDGLPAIRGQKSVDILYQQSFHTNSQNSVALLDPTVKRTASLAQVPSDIKSYVDPATGYTYFNELPPDLRERLYWNPNAVGGPALELIGQYKEMTDSRYNYLRLNVLGDSNRVAALKLAKAGGDWAIAINKLPKDPVILTNDTKSFDSLALSAGVGQGRGYVTLVFNNSSSTNRSGVQDGDVIDLKVIRVDQPKYVGKLDSILSTNPLDQQQNMRYTADFAGKPQSYEFQWQYASGSNPDSWNDFGPLAQGQDSITLGDAGLFGLSDHWIRCRYRAFEASVQKEVGTEWSEWTPPALAEGWIKRVMNDITPYEQRIKNFHQGLLTTLDMVAQAGPPYAGDVPLNIESLNQNGLIQIYQTVIEKGRKLSIDSGFNDPDASQAMLLAAGRLSDLYMLLGNEAYADALDPTIGLGTSDPVWGSAAASIFCFMNQVPTLLDEELALLRGRDDSRSPSIDTYPVYNRLFWNFTGDITGGEVAYALNYDIRDANGKLDGVINEADARALYPQGHGDAWGHYLSSIKAYYSLLHNTNFVWIPQSEAVNVGTEPVSVSYLHEQRFCQSAAAKARTGALIVGDTYRSLFAGEDTDTWQTMRDSNTNRCWGVAEWGSRAGMGAYFDWIVGNALLPGRDNNPAHSGIGLIDRKTVLELPEITSQYGAVQDQVDRADGGMNPLGLANGVVPFDISPADADAGQTHFDQSYARAVDAWRNAMAVFDNVRFNAQALRDQAENQETFNKTVAEAEIDFTNRLAEIYGYPFADDIGSGKAYPQGYQGPDLIHYNYIDTEYITGLANTGRTIAVTLTNITVDAATVEESSPHLASETQTVEFYIGAQGLPSKPANYTGQRRAEGRVQMALGEFVRALTDMRRSLDEFHQLNQDIQERAEMLRAKSSTFTDINAEMVDAEDYVKKNNLVIAFLAWMAKEAEVMAEIAAKFGEAMAEEIPTGIHEVFKFAHGVPKVLGAGVYSAVRVMQPFYETKEKVLELNNEEKAKESERLIKEKEHNLELEDDLAELRILARSQETKNLEVQTLLAAVDSARMGYESVLAEGQRLQVERETFRMHTAGTLQADRYRNMAFRIFRNDALQRYQAAFDLAARYVYLAAKAYDYETALPLATSATLSGRSLMAQIARARSLGRCSIVNETFDLPEPLAAGATGDPGLADMLARLKANWGVLKGRYGFNNPENETGRFSLRTELFRISPDSEGDADWRSKLGGCYVTNLLSVQEFKRFCLPFGPVAAAEPALVIPFESTIQFGKNFFGFDLAAGDNAYDSSRFATKIRSVGVWFANFNNVFNTNLDHGGGLANMPRVYLIPIGLDVARVPSGDQTQLRTWAVFDQALPVPYPLTQEDLVNPNWIPLQDSLGGGFGTLRKYPALRAYHDAGFDVSEMTYSSRLIGRSVWNTRWLLIIPGRTLLSDGDEGIQRFIHGAKTAGVRDENGIKDIRIFFQTYSYSGN